MLEELVIVWQKVRRAFLSKTEVRTQTSEDTELTKCRHFPFFFYTYF